MTVQNIVAVAAANGLTISHAETKLHAAIGRYCGYDSRSPFGKNRKGGYFVKQ